MHQFRAAVQARDLDAISALLADDATFLSPGVFAPYHGREVVAAIVRVFEDFRYECELAGVDGRDHALVFRARIGDRRGARLRRPAPRRRPDAELCVMVRPLSAAPALAEAMRRELA